MGTVHTVDLVGTLLGIDGAAERGSLFVLL